MSGKIENKIFVSPLDLQIAPLPSAVMKIMAADSSIINAIVTYGRGGQPYLAYCVLNEKGEQVIVPAHSYIPKVVLEFSLKTSSPSSSSSSSLLKNNSSKDKKKKEKKRKVNKKKVKPSSQNTALTTEEWAKLSPQEACGKFFSQFERKQYKDHVGALVKALNVRVGERFANNGDMLTKIKNLSSQVKTKEDFLKKFSSEISIKDLARLFVSNRLFLALSKQESEILIKK